VRPAPKPLPRRFYARDPREVAPELLGKLLVRGERVGRIVEVEAYVGSIDAGSHAFRGPTRRNSTMFGPPGRLYVYFTYGMHWCANAVCEEAGVGHAVLLRAVAPVAGLAEMRAARGSAVRERDLANGPAKLCQAFGIDGAFDGADLVTGAGGGVLLCDDGTPPPEPGAVGNSLRIGLAHGKGHEHPWRWFVEGDPNVSPGTPGKPPAKKRRPRP
jgi:DNA-3-methyladenine glycosylase